MVGVPVLIDRFVIPCVTPAGELLSGTSEKPSLGAALGICCGNDPDLDDGN